MSELLERPVDGITAVDGIGTLDEIVRLAARRDPAGVAIRTTAQEVTFAGLDARVDRCAAAIGGLLGTTGSAVAVAPVLDPAYPTVFYGALRAGNAVVNVNPMLREQALERILGAARVRVVVAPAEMAARIATVRDRLPLLETVVVLGPDATHGDRTFGDLLAADVPWSPSREAAPDDLACIHFTSGTTGDPKAVGLTHRNLVANAIQTAHAHDLDEDAVVLNHVPFYHLMHLSSAVYAGATQVLCREQDVVASVRMANEHRATTYMSLPVRLAHLAADPRLPGLRFDTVRAIRAGGTALAAEVAGRLSAQFGVPAMQGYGMAETSALTHSDVAARPRPGSVGPAVPFTECRVVDLETAAPLAVGAVGEVQVRGPQVMSGYLNRPGTPELDAAGWLSTGDVGRLDEDGYLFLVDRRGDVFKCENELVSPTEIEQVLGAHPLVAQCAVVAYPDPFRGSVAFGLVVPVRDLTGEETAAIAAEVNGNLPYFHHLKAVEVIPEIPGALFGKIQRRALRAQLLERHAAAD